MTEVRPGLSTNGAGAESLRDPFLTTLFNKDHGRFSPDGHWVAYTSDESGKYEVYVRPFPIRAGGGGKVQVSTGQNGRHTNARSAGVGFAVRPDELAQGLRTMFRTAKLYESPR